MSLLLEWKAFIYLHNRGRGSLLLCQTLSNTGRWIKPFCSATLLFFNLFDFEFFSLGYFAWLFLRSRFSRCCIENLKCRRTSCWRGLPAIAFRFLCMMRRGAQLTCLKIFLLYKWKEAFCVSIRLPGWPLLGTILFLPFSARRCSPSFQPDKPLLLEVDLGFLAKHLLFSQLFFQISLPN